MKRKKQTFEEMYKIGQRYYNDRGFCGVVAVAAAAEVSFGKARATLANKKHKSPRKTRTGTDMVTLRDTLKTLGCTITNIHSDNPNEVNAWCAKGTTHKTLGKTCRMLPKDGVYLVHTTRHITCVDHGDIVDWATDKNRSKVVDVYKITRNYK